jgi:hypothetical protein
MPFARRRRVDLYLSAAAARRLISVGGGGARFSAARRRRLWCILKTENKIILKGFDSSKNTIKSHIATSDDLNTVYS